LKKLLLQKNRTFFLAFLLVGIYLNLAAQNVEVFPQLGHTGPINSVAFSPDGKQIVSGSDDNTVKLWDMTTGREIKTFSGHSRFVKSVTFSPDGRWIVSGSDDNTVKLWDTATGFEIRTFLGHSSIVSSVAFSPDGRQILSGSWDNTVKLWDLATDHVISTFSGHTGIVSSVAFSPDGRQILSGSWDNTIKLWDTSTNREIRTFFGHSYLVSSVTFSPDGRQLISGSYDNTVKLWDTTTDREIKTFSGHSYFVSSVIFSPDGRQIVSSSNITKLWDLATGRESRTFSGHPYNVNSIAFSPDGKQIISGSGIWDKTIKLWDLATGREISTFSGHSNSVNSIAFSPDGKQIISGSGSIFDSGVNSTVKLWDVLSSREIKTFSGHSDIVTSVVFSPDGKQILSGSWDSTVKLWDTATGLEIRTFLGHSGFVTSVAFSPDGKQIISGSNDKTIKLWDTATNCEIKTFSGHSNSVTSVAFSSDGRQIISGSWDNTIKLWDVATNRETKTFSGHSNSVTSVAFSPDGKTIISGSSDGTTRLWDTFTGEEIVQFISFTDGEWIVITPDGYYNASANGDRYLNVRVENTVYGIDQFRKIFYKPDYVTAQLTARQNAGAGQQNIQNVANFLPPSIIVNSPAQGSTITSNTVNLSINILDDNWPVTSVRVLVNGYLYHKSEPNYQYVRWEGTLLPTQVGENHIEVITTGASESRKKTTFYWQPASPPAPRKPDLYLLAIGVGQYENIGSLPYSANAARGIAEAFKAQEGLMYNRVYTRILADGESVLPTAANIRSNLQFLNQGTPDDYYVLYFMGHGGEDGQGGFFFTARDFNWVVPSSRISSDDITAVLDLPGKRIAFIDACHSGGVTGGPIDNDKLTRILKESNAVIFSAARGVQYGWQLGDPIQSSAFAYSIRKSLMEGPGGNVMLLTFAGDVMRETQDITRNIVYDGQTYSGQYPNISALNLEDFPIAVRRGTAASITSSAVVSTSMPSAANPPPDWTPLSPSSIPSSQQTVTGADIGLLQWGISEMFR